MYEIFVRMKKIAIILLVIGALIGCSKSQDSTTLSSVAQITAMYLAANDSFPGFANASFAVEERGDTGYIFTKDSIMFNTPIERAVVRFTYAATPSRVTFIAPAGTKELSGKDTLDLTQNSMYFRVLSQDGKIAKYYRLLVQIHQVDPDLFHWDKVCNAVGTPSQDQRALLFNDELYYFIQENNAVSLYTSLEGDSWTKQTVSGLPNGCSTEHIIAAFDNLYCIGPDHKLYGSADGLDWSMINIIPANTTVLALLFPLGEYLWAIGQDEQQNLRGYYFTNDNWGGSIAIPAKTGIQNFAAALFASPSFRERAMIMGGVDLNGEPTNSHLNFEYSPTISEPGNVRLTEYTNQHPDLDTLIGASLIWYVETLYRIGGVNKEDNYLPSPMYETFNEGLDWSVPDSTKNVLPAELTERRGVSTIVKDYDLYIIGGYNNSGAFSDVYKGRKLSADWY